ERSPAIVFLCDLIAHEREPHPATVFLIVEKITLLVVSLFTTKRIHMNHPGTLLHALHVHTIEGIASHADEVVLPLSITIQGNEEEGKKNEAHRICFNDGFPKLDN